MRFSGRALEFGVQDRQVTGGKIRVYSPAKTVADCFKFRNKIGQDVALEALRDVYRPKKQPWTSSGKPPKFAASRMS